MYNISDRSLSLFISLAQDAGNWAGQPIIDIDAQARGNLTQLKRAKLLRTFTDRDVAFAIFTNAGRDFASAHGVDLSDFDTVEDLDARYAKR
jgi:hypothetical protein